MRETKYEHLFLLSHTISIEYFHLCDEHPVNCPNYRIYHIRNCNGNHSYKDAWLNQRRRKKNEFRKIDEK